MKTSNSNKESRNKAIRKAILLVLIPMIFAAMGSSLVNQVDNVDADQINKLGGELANIKKNRDSFLIGLQKVDSIWMVYQRLQQQTLQLTDSLNQGNLATKIDQKETEIKLQLNQLESSSLDTSFVDVYRTVINNYRALFNNYLDQVEDKKMVQNCLFGKVSAEDLLDEKRELEKENLDLITSLRLCETNKLICVNHEREIDQLEKQLRDCVNDLNRAFERIETESKEKQGIVKSYDSLIDLTIKNIEKLKVEGLCIGCNKKEVNKKIDEITDEIANEKRKIIP